MNQSSHGAIIVSNKAYDLNALGAIRSLGKNGVNTIWITPDRTKWYYSRYCKPTICPDFRTEEKLFIQFMCRLGKKKKLKDFVLIPTSDASLITISKNKGILEKYFEPMVCDWGTTQKFIEKTKSYKIAASIGIPTPKTFYPKDKDEAMEISSKVDYPCLIKPSTSHTFTEAFKTKLFKIYSPIELFKTYSTLTSKGFDVMIQEDIPGEDKDLVTLNTVFNDHSEPLAVFMHRRLRQNPPRYGVVALGESIWEPRIIQPAIKLLKTIGFQGIAHVEFKLDSKTNKFKFVEVNGRSYLSMSLPKACGINLLHIAYRNALGEVMPPLKNYKCTYECGVKWLDFPSYIESMFKLRKITSVPLSQFVKPLLNRRTAFATFSKDDPAPFLMELFHIFKNFRKIIRVVGAFSD